MNITPLRGEIHGDGQCGHVPTLSVPDLSVPDLSVPEHWRRHWQFRNYEISDRGRVRNRRTGRLLAPFINDRDAGAKRLYRRVCLYRTRRDKTRVKRLFYVHRLVACYHVKGRTASARFVHHIDGDVSNNVAPNLQWVCNAEHYMIHRLGLIADRGGSLYDEEPEMHPDWNHPHWSYLTDTREVAPF
jgi:hypothetical protein